VGFSKMTNKIQKIKEIKKQKENELQNLNIYRGNIICHKAYDTSKALFIEIQTILYEESIPVYCLAVEGSNNFAVDLGDNSCVVVHNCESVHSECNAIISAGRERTIGATLYLAGKNMETGESIVGEPCLLCRRIIKNAGIEKVIVLGVYTTGV
jgi:tRNA(Arg) A34 adenosine deaminase TadA